MNISQNLSEYESWRENAKEVLRQCKKKLDTLNENAFVEPTTTPSSVVRFESEIGAYLLYAYPYYCILFTYMYFCMNICEYTWMHNIYALLHNYILAYIYIYIYIYI